QAHLPLGESSLKMGTRDGGKTVLNSDPALDAAVREGAHRLNLRGHQVRGKTLFAAADVEGHEGQDSRRYYLLDLARAFPPEDPAA
ncbi:unnamed protein product, partial [Discosporangium mesarthrocarpum]